jgi:hypothetical protein
MRLPAPDRRSGSSTDVLRDLARRVARQRLSALDGLGRPAYRMSGSHPTLSPLTLAPTGNYENLFAGLAALAHAIASEWLVP